MNKARIIGGTLLVTGVAIGAGMLALPAVTGILGFWPTMGIFILGFLFTLYSGLILLEANLSMPAGSNIISMANRYLGTWGKVVAWLMYLLFLYAIVAAYTTGGGGILAEVLKEVNITLPEPLVMLIFLVVFGAFVYFGTRSVDYINQILMLGLGVSFIALLVFVTPHVKTALLIGQTGTDIRYIWYAIPIVVLAFSAQLVIPTIRSYHNNNTKEIIIVLLGGTLLPLIFYVMWELTVLGIVPIPGLTAMNHSANAVTSLIDALTLQTGAYALGNITAAFSFFALVTSFLGSALSLTHFLKDGLNLSNKKSSHWFNIVLTFLPGYLFAVFYPQGFVMALAYAGVFILVLFGVLPAMMVWKLRYIDKQTTSFRVHGGKAMLILVGLGSVLLIVAQLLATFGVLPKP